MIKASWEWRINGRKVSPDQAADEMARGVLKQAKEGVEKSIAGVRCPVHGAGPSDIQVSEAKGKLTFTYRTCCDKLREAVEASFQ